jgi:hypothetical protein
LGEHREPRERLGLVELLEGLAQTVCRYQPWCFYKV